MKAYLDAFRKRASSFHAVGGMTKLTSTTAEPPLELPENASQGDQTLKLAFEATDAGNYAHAVTLTEEAIQQGLSTPQLEGRAYNQRGTFKYVCLEFLEFTKACLADTQVIRFIMADAPGALADMDKSTDLYRGFTQTWIKKASVHMELG